MYIMCVLFYVLFSLQGSVIVKRGEVTKALFFIMSGTAEVRRLTVR
jgi:CRP-like cAMP-binding protein